MKMGEENNTKNTNITKGECHRTRDH